MKEREEKGPGLPTLLRIARGDKAEMKRWMNWIEKNPGSRRKIELLRKLDRFFEAHNQKQEISGLKKLAGEVFERYLKDRHKSHENIVHLYYDSQVIPLREGFRPSLVSERRLKYTGETGTIELSVVPVFPGRFEVTGRLEHTGARQTSEVHLEGREKHRTQVDEFGFFTFGAVNPGKYQLIFVSEGSKAVARNIDLK